MIGDQPVLVIDNGGHTLKALYIPNPRNTVSQPPRQAVIPNCVGATSFAGRGLVGEQLFRLPHFHGFMVRRPVERGFVVDAALQSYIWEYLLQLFAIADESDVELLLTVPFAAPKQVGELLHYLAAQRFKFRAVTLVSATFLALVAAASRDWLHGGGGGDDGGCGMVVDFGFSATTVVPYVDFIPLRDSAVRVDVGGKLLANRLKELISFTQVNMTEDGWLVNHIMERCCCVELRPHASLRAAQRRRRRGRAGGVAELRYYLPTVPPLMPLGCREEELHAVMGGDVAAEKRALQHLVFKHEAFLIPELLFHPVDVGIQQMGVVEATTRGTRLRGLLHEAPTLHSALVRRVVAFGGTAKFPQLRERLRSELQKELVAGDGGGNNRGAAATTTDLPLTLQPLVERHRMAPDSIKASDGAAGYSPHDSELQPLFGALALLTCPSRQPQLQLLCDRSRIELSSLRTGRAAMGRTQAASVLKTQNAFLDALQRFP